MTLHSQSLSPRYSCPLLMFNVAIDQPPQCYWNDIMSCPPGYRGREAGVRMWSPSWADTEVLFGHFKGTLVSLGGDIAQTCQDTLLETTSEACQIHRSSFASRKPPPSFPISPSPLDWDLNRNSSRHIWPVLTPLLPLSAFKLIYQRFIFYQVIHQPSSSTLLLDQRGSISPYAGSQLTLHTFCVSRLVHHHPCSPARHSHPLCA